MAPSERDEPPTGSAGDAAPAAGDWLAEVGARAGLATETIDALAGWLAQQAEVDRFAQLERAGHSIEERIPLARVFVDLQTAPVPVTEIGRNQPETLPFLGFLNLPWEERHAPLYERYEEARRRERLDLSDKVEGYALIGGPGQGKSTLGQLLCQLQRTWLLRPRLDRLATSAERDAVEAFTNDAAVATLGRPAELRFPIRIALADAAAWLARRGDAVGASADALLLTYLRERAACPVEPGVLLRLLSAGDWLLVLDGLDEVPPSADRSRLLAASRDLLQRLIAGGQHGLLLGTTRPQGYGGELDELGIALRSRFLAPFGTEEALAYARRLVDARFSSDRREKVLHRLEQAAHGETTARLMSTPLQVTILATLVDRIGRAPSEQWTLFREYYRVIYEREMERPFEAAQILREYRRYVDKIHAHIGLLLQVEAEQVGGTESAFSRERFRHVVDAVLAEDEIDGTRRHDLVRRIDEALRERLVLLVDRGQDQLGFEIRSIQEFMAAWALSQKGEAVVEQRIRQIAKAGAFRNVVLFLASKAFTDTDTLDLRDAFTDRICPWLNEDPDDELSRAALTGSVLALEILEEGSALKQDKYVRKLVSLAVRLLELSSQEAYPRRLAAACLKDEDAKQIALPLLNSSIVDRLKSDPHDQRLEAWTLLLPLVDSGVDWAEAIVEQAWENETPQSKNNIRNAAAKPALPISRWLERKVNQEPHVFSPIVSKTFFSSSREMPHRTRAVQALSTRKFDIQISASFDEYRFWLQFSSIRGREDITWDALADMGDVPPAWRPWVAVARFLRKPNKETLANELLQLADLFDDERVSLKLLAWPWPLRACLARSTSGEDLRAFASRAASGQLGDAEDWDAAEFRWRNGHEVDLRAALSTNAETWPNRGTIGDGDFVLSGSSLSLTRVPIKPPQGRPWVDGLRAWFAASTDSWARSWLAPMIALGIESALLSKQPLVPGVTAIEMERLYAAGSQRFSYALIAALREDTADLAPLLDLAGRRLGFMARETAPVDVVDRIVRAYVQYPEKVGILHILRVLALSPTRIDLPHSLLEPDRIPGRLAKRSAAIIQLTSSTVTAGEAAELAMLAATYDYDLPVTRIFEARDAFGYPDIRETMLLALRAASPGQSRWFRREVDSEIRGVISRRQSNLTDPAVWDRLHLPLPRPERRQVSDRPPPSEQPRIQVGPIALQNLRAFEDFSIVPTEPPADAGQWIVLLGENGMGKTTILRSLVFALVDVTSQPNRLPRSAFEIPWRRRGTDKDMPSAVQVSVNGTTYRATITAADSGKEALRQEAPYPSSPVFAYGCRRGSALGGGTRRVDVDPGAEIPTLFDEGADLIHAETWLLLREAAGMRDRADDGPAWRIYQSILKALLSMLPGIEAIEARGDKVWVRGPEVGEVPLEALSDGYLTTMGWVIDLIARWIKRAEIRKDPISDDFTKTMTGLVLIDEIDLLLHPEWQRHVIADVRAIFPRLSFIVTTHNPLTLLGAKADEIWKLTRNGGGRITAVQGREQPALMTGSEILDTYFDIKSLFPDDLGKMSNRYNFLARDAVRTDEEDAEMRSLLAKLRQRGVEPGVEPVPREEIPPYPGDAPA